MRYLRSLAQTISRDLRWYLRNGLGLLDGQVKSKLSGINPCRAGSHHIVGGAE